MMELVARPERGRRYSATRTVRVSDAGPDGALRLDGVARYLQDIATDDWVDSGFSTEDTWVVRRAYVELADGGRWPRYNEEVTAVTWCAGTGPAWAERRTDLEVEGQVMVRATALWVLVDELGRPLRLEDRFQKIYGEACGGRKASRKVPAAPSAGDLAAPNVSSQPWAVRKADIDVVGHVNNAAIWSAVVEAAPAGLRTVDLVHHGALDAEGSVSLCSWPGHLCLLARASGPAGGGTTGGDGATLAPDRASARGGGPELDVPELDVPELDVPELDVPELDVRVSAVLSVSAGPARG
jgi:acyl-ACP thioesterase